MNCCARVPAWILDETVFKRSLEAPCTDAAEDLDAAKVLGYVQAHGRWVFSDAIRERYLSNWKMKTCTAPLTVRTFLSLRNLMWDAERSLLLDGVEAINGRYHGDDEFIVSAAAAVREDAILVTEDGRLRTRLAMTGIPAEFGFTVVDVAGALAIQAV